MQEKPGAADRPGRFLAPANVFLAAGLVIGILYCIVIPYGAGFDEERHLARIYYMSKYQFLPNVPRQTIHKEVADLSYQRRYIQTPAFDMFSAEYFGRRFGKLDKDLRYGQETRSVYSPAIFLVQALIGRALWWKFDFPILPTIILERIAGLLIYVAGGYAAIRVLPYGKWILAVLMLSPSALYQAATLNGDGFTNAVSFAFIGWVLCVYANEPSGVRPRSVWVLVALAILLGLAKPGAIVLLPLLLLLVRHPFPSNKWVALLGAGAALAIFVNVGWAVLATRGSDFSETGSQSISGQLELILSDPVGFFRSLQQAAVYSLPYLIQGGVAAYGYWAGRVPGPVYFFSALLILGTFLAEPRPAKIPSRTRIFLVALFLFCCAGIFVFTFVTSYAAGGMYALAKHGRYYLPFPPLLFLGVSGLVAVRESIQRLAKFTAIGSFLLVTGYYSFGIYAAYYTYCGYDAYVVGKCLLPIYKNLEKDIAPEVTLAEGGLVSQTFTDYCGRLEMVQIFIKSVPQDSEGSLQFALLDENQRILAGRDFPVRGMAAGDYLSLPVDMPSGSQSANYEIRLGSMDLSPSGEIRLAITPADYYPGELLLNGAKKRGDLLIHYLCASP